MDLGSQMRLVPAKDRLRNAAVAAVLSGFVVDFDRFHHVTSLFSSSSKGPWFEPGRLWRSCAP